MIIIGIDPGTVITGYGIIKIDGPKQLVLDFGCIKPPPNLKLSERYQIIFDSLEQLMEQHQPHVAVLETQFVGYNPQTTIKLGMARGMGVLAARRKGMRIFQYSPTQVKKAMTGSGRASKQQIKFMMKQLLNLLTNIPEDAADALALAVCHAQIMNVPHLKSTEV